MFRAYKEANFLEKQLKELMAQWRDTLDYLETALPKSSPEDCKKHLECLKSFDQQFAAMMTRVIEENNRLKNTNAELKRENEQLKQDMERMQERTRKLEAQLETCNSSIEQLQQQRKEDKKEVQKQLDDIRKQLGLKTERVHKSFKALSQVIIAANRFAAGPASEPVSA